MKRETAGRTEGEEGFAPGSHPRPLTPARLAIYDSPAVAPRVVELSADDYEEFIGLLASRTYELSQQKGGAVPYTIIREVIENLIHAYFNEVVITILDDGNTVRISDQGPGISDKKRAVEPGFSTATREMKRFIRGVGSGLPIVKESLRLLGGAISIEDNLAKGSVITIRIPDKATPRPSVGRIAEPRPTMVVSHRQRRVLSLILEYGVAGPSVVARTLDISLSTVHRDLLYLEEQGLVVSDTQGKRSLTPRGIEILATS